jgi:hypothetical protein
MLSIDPFPPELVVPAPVVYLAKPQQRQRPRAHYARLDGDVQGTSVEPRREWVAAVCLEERVDGLELCVPRALRWIRTMRRRCESGLDAREGGGRWCGF